MLCSKCGRKIPKGEEVQREGYRSGQGKLFDEQGGVMCRKCAFPPFYKKVWFWILVGVGVILLIGAISSAFKP